MPHECCSFAIECILGRGSQGTVYKARDESNGAVVVLKCLSLAGIGKWDNTKVCQEASILQSLHHENIVRCFGSFKHEGYLVISMQVPSRVARKRPQ